MVWSTPGLDISVVGCREGGREEDSMVPFSLCRNSEQQSLEIDIESYRSCLVEGIVYIKQPLIIATRTHVHVNSSKAQSLLV